MNRTVRRIFDVAADTVWPPVCHGCGRGCKLDVDELCNQCTASVSSAMQIEFCPGCGRSVAPYELTADGCGECRETGRLFTQVFRIAAYQDGFADLFRRFKYGGYENLELFFARTLARQILKSEHYEHIDALIPVPTCWQHRLRRHGQGVGRGFHPAEGIAKLVSKHTSIPCAPLLDRIRGGKSQVGLSGAARLVNVRGKFALAKGCQVAGGRVCIVDDIMTTGATVRECARVLRRGGVENVYVAVVARAGEDASVLNVV